jgi:uncharacterized membrane protein
MGLAGLLLSVAFAAAVEAVEALTIILAIGFTRGWRATWQGVGAGLATLAVVVAAVGPALNRIPLAPLRVVVGGVLLIFGLQWLRKAILRASGYKALHDEEAAYAAEIAEAETATRDGRFAVSDWYAFTVVFKAVVLEGLEVAFIVLTFGATSGHLGYAVFGAAIGVLVISALGLVVRAPLARIPENAIKFGVGTMLTTFGMFWSGEGAGADWPGDDLAILGLLAITASLAGLCVAVLRRVHARSVVEAV